MRHFRYLAITFDTGKATIKPESTGEINRITKIMTDDASIKFEVQGHIFFSLLTNRQVQLTLHLQDACMHSRSRTMLASSHYESCG